MAFDQVLTAFLKLGQQGVEGLVALQRAQVLGVGRGNVDRDVVSVRVHAFQADQVVVDGVFNGGDGVLADVQAQDAAVLAEARALDVGQEGVQAVVVEAQAVDERVGLGQAEHAGLGVAGLGLRGHGAHFDEAKAHGAQAIDDAAVLVQTGGHAHPVGEGDARDFDRVTDPLGAPQAGEGGVLKTGLTGHGQLVRGLRVHFEQHGFRQGVGK